MPRTVTPSAAVNVLSGGYSAGRLARLFRAYQGAGSEAEKLIFDVDPNATTPIDGVQVGMRLLLPDGTSSISDAPFSLLD
jgi:hypothetical protein